MEAHLVGQVDTVVDHEARHGPTERSVGSQATREQPIGAAIVVGRRITAPAVRGRSTESRTRIPNCSSPNLDAEDAWLCPSSAACCMMTTDSSRRAPLGCASSSSSDQGDYAQSLDPFWILRERCYRTPPRARSHPVEPPSGDRPPRFAPLVWHRSNFRGARNELAYPARVILK